MTSVLVLGRTGQIGFELMRAPWPAGWTVAGTDRSEVDAMRPDTIRAAIDRHRPDLVVNAIAYTQVDEAESERDLAFAVTADAVARLGAYAAARDLPVLHISTDYVFDGSGTRPWRETDATGPLNIYGASKLAGEQALLAAHPRAIILRTSWVYGVQGSNFVKTMLRLGRERSELGVVADQHGAPTAAADIASALAEIARQTLASPTTASPRGIFHFAAAGETTWHGFAEEIFDALAAREGRRPICNAIASGDYPAAARRPLNSRLDCSRITETFSIRPPHWRASLRPALAELLDR